MLALAIPAAAARGYSRRADSGRPADRNEEGIDVRPRFGAVVSFLIHQRFLRNMILLTSVTASALAFAQGSVVLLLLQTFSVPPAAIGVVTAAVGVGALIGALSASIFVGRFGRGRVMFSAVLVSGAGILGVGLTSDIVIAIAAYAVGAFGVAVWNVPWGALRQAIVPSDMLGRAMGIIRTIGWGLTPIATILGGFVARIDLRLPFVIGGGLVVVLSLIAARLLLSAGAQVPQQANETQGNAS
jgi:MFS family permease